MFYEAESFNEPLNNWNVSKVKCMAAMFRTPPRIFWDFGSRRIDFFLVVLFAFLDERRRRREYFLGILRLLLVTRKKKFLIIFSTKPNEIYLKVLRCRWATYR